MASRPHDPGMVERHEKWIRPRIAKTVSKYGSEPERSLDLQD